MYAQHIQSLQYHLWHYLFVEVIFYIGVIKLAYVRTLTNLLQLLACNNTNNHPL